MKNRYRLYKIYYIYKDYNMNNKFSEIIFVINLLIK